MRNGCRIKTITMKGTGCKIILDKRMAGISKDFRVETDMQSSCRQVIDSIYHHRGNIESIVSVMWTTNGEVWTAYSKLKPSMTAFASVLMSDLAIDQWSRCNV